MSSKNSNYNTYYIYTEILNSLVQGERSSETSVKINKKINKKDTLEYQLTLQNNI